jgi:hypothetical protein
MFWLVMAIFILALLFAPALALFFGRRKPG